MYIPEKRFICPTRMPSGITVYSCCGCAWYVDVPADDPSGPEAFDAQRCEDFRIFSDLLRGEMIGRSLGRADCYKLNGWQLGARVNVRTDFCRAISAIPLRESGGYPVCATFREPFYFISAPQLAAAPSGPGQFAFTVPESQSWGV